MSGVSYRGGKPVSRPSPRRRIPKGGISYRGGKRITPGVSPVSGVSATKYRAAVPFMTASYITAGMPGMTAKGIAMFTKAATMPSRLTHSERAYIREHLPSMRSEYRKKFVQFETQERLSEKLKKKKKELKKERLDIRRVPGVSTALLMGVTPETKRYVEKMWGWKLKPEREFERRHGEVITEMATWKRTPQGEPITPHELVPKAKQLKVEHEELITKARERGWMTAEGVIEYPSTPAGIEWAREEREIAGRAEKYITPEGYYKEEYYVPTKKGAETIKEIKWLEKRSEELAAPTVMAKERTEGMWVAPVVTKATEFGEWWGKEVAAPFEKAVKKYPRAVTGLGLAAMPMVSVPRYVVKKGIEDVVPKEYKPYVTKVPLGVTDYPISFTVGVVKGIPDVPIMAAEVPYAGEYITRRPKEAAVIAPGVTMYMAKGMYKEARERPVEFAGRTAGMMAISGGIGKVSPIKMAKVDITPTMAWRGIGIATPFKKTFHPIVGVKRRELMIGEPFKIPTVPEITKIKGAEKVRVEIPPEGFEGIATIRAGKMPQEVFLEPKAAAEMASGIEIMRKHAKVKPEVKRPLREIYIERIPKKSMVEVEKILREHEHVVYGSAVQEMYLKKAPRRAHDIDIGIRKKDIPTVRKKLITTLEKEVGEGKVRRAPTGEGIEVLTKKGWRHAVDIHPLSWQKAFHEAPPFGVKLRPWEKVNGITTISLGEQWVKKGTTWLVPEYAKAGKLGVKTEWRIKDVPGWSKISRDIEASVMKSAEAAILFKPLKKAKAKVLGRELEKIRTLEKEKYPEVSAFFSGVPYSPYAKTLIPLRKFPHKIKGIYPPVGTVPSYAPSYVPIEYREVVSDIAYPKYPSRVYPEGYVKYDMRKPVREAYPRGEPTVYPKPVRYPKLKPTKYPKPIKYPEPKPTLYPEPVPTPYPKLIPHEYLKSVPYPEPEPTPRPRPQPIPEVIPFAFELPKAKPRKKPRAIKKAYAWRVENPIPELQEMFSKEMHKRRFV